MFAILVPHAVLPVCCGMLWNAQEEKGIQRTSESEWLSMVEEGLLFTMRMHKLLGNRDMAKQSSSLSNASVYLPACRSAFQVLPRRGSQIPQPG